MASSTRSTFPGCATGCEPGQKLPHLGLRPFGHHGNGTVVEIPRFAGEPQLLGLAHGPVAEAHTLDHAKHPGVQPDVPRAGACVAWPWRSSFQVSARPPNQAALVSRCGSERHFALPGWANRVS